MSPQTSLVHAEPAGTVAAPQQLAAATCRFIALLHTVVLYTIVSSLTDLRRYAQPVHAYSPVFHVMRTRMLRLRLHSKEVYCIISFVFEMTYLKKPRMKRYLSCQFCFSNAKHAKAGALYTKIMERDKVKRRSGALLHRLSIKIYITQSI